MLLDAMNERYKRVHTFLETVEVHCESVSRLPKAQTYVSLAYHDRAWSTEHCMAHGRAPFDPTMRQVRAPAMSVDEAKAQPG